MGQFLWRIGPFLTDYEALYDSPDWILQETVFILMESAVLALQQVIPSAIDRGLNCASVLQEIFTNFRILFLDLTRRRETQTSSTCSNLEIPKVEPSGRPGRPKFEISAEVILELRSYGFTWKQIADMLLVSRWTIRRRVVEIWIKLTGAWARWKMSLFAVNIALWVNYFVDSG